VRLLQDQREALQTFETTALAGIAAQLAQATEHLVATAERLERMQPVEWMDLDQAAVHVGISPGSFANTVTSEGIPKHYFTDRKPKFSRQELDAWLMAR
jgi:hypothetical protein